MGWALVSICLIFFADNGYWIFHTIQSKGSAPDGTYATAEQLNTLETLGKETDPEDLILSSDPAINYLSTVFTPAYPVYSHPYTTPFVSTKRKEYEEWMKNSTIANNWKNREVFFVISRNDSLKYEQLNNLQVEKIMKNNEYTIIKTVP